MSTYRNILISNDILPRLKPGVYEINEKAAHGSDWQGV
jgi:hypothetical protein